MVTDGLQSIFIILTMSTVSGRIGNKNLIDTIMVRLSHELDMLNSEKFIQEDENQKSDVILPLNWDC